jgi:hypothetical protein
MPEEENQEHREEHKEEDKPLDDPDEKEASDLITAAHNNSKQLGLGIWKRFLELAIKLIGVKGLFFGVCTWFYSTKSNFPLEVWVISGLLLIGGSYLDLVLAKWKR